MSELKRALIAALVVAMAAGAPALHAADASASDNGSFLGGLFGRKKTEDPKPEPTADTPPPSEPAKPKKKGVRDRLDAFLGGGEQQPAEEQVPPPVEPERPEPAPRSTPEPAAEPAPRPEPDPSPAPAPPTVAREPEAAPPAPAPQPAKPDRERRGLGDRLGGLFGRDRDRPAEPAPQPAPAPAPAPKAAAPKPPKPPKPPKAEKPREERRGLGDRLGGVFGRSRDRTPPPSVQPQPAPAVSAATSPAQAVSDLPTDPALRFGVLPNGMRYVLMRNATPPGQTSLRLVVKVGSLMEEDDQRGLAHFLEHMAFNGTENVPEGEMVKILERAGLAFGPDTNARTGFDRTVYELDLPRSDDGLLDTGLMLLREAAGSMLLDAEAIDRERGVVLSEERARASPAYRVMEARYRFLLKGQRVPDRFPIGLPDVLSTAGRDRFEALYHAYYRPERTALVAVGDFDVDAMEAKIRTRFSDWSARGRAGAEPNLGPVAQRGTEVEVVVEPGGPSSVQLAWVNPPDLRPDSRAIRMERVVRDLGFAVLNRRLGRLSREASPPFISAAAYRYTEVNAADITLLQVTGQPGQWRENLTAVEQEQRRIAEFGVQQPELDREIAEYRAALEAAVAGTATRRTPLLARGIVESLGDEEVFTADDYDLALFEEAIQGLTAARVSAVIKGQFAGQGPLIFVASTTPIQGEEATVLAAFEQMRRNPVSAPAAIAVKPWPYTDFGADGQVVETRDILDMDTTFIRFANGVRLTIKPTRFRDDQILVSVRTGGGYLALPKDRVSMTWAAGLSFVDGGLGRMTADEIEQALASNVVSTSLTLDEDAFVLTGRTRPQDLLRQLQLLAAYTTDPAWRPEPFERARAYGLSLQSQLRSTPGGMFSTQAEAMLRSGDPRWRFPDEGEFRSARLEDLKRLINGELSRGPLEVIVVGDVNVDTVIEEVAATFGALPRRAAAPARAPDADQIRFPSPPAQPVRLTHTGRADQAMAYIAWPTVDFRTDPQKARRIRMLEQVLSLRLTDELRERQGVTYSPSTGLEAGWAFPGYGYVSASVQAPPDKLEGFFATVLEIARDLRDKPITVDELERARRPRAELITRSQATNEYWLGQLEGGQTEPARLDAIRSAVPGLERVTIADVQAAAREFLRDERALRVVVTPQPAATAAPSPAPGQ